MEAEKIIYTNAGFVIWQLASDYFEVCGPSGYALACFDTEEDARDAIKQRLNIQDEMKRYGRH